MTDSVVTAMSVKVYFGGLTGPGGGGVKNVGVEPYSPVSVKSGYAFISYNGSLDSVTLLSKNVGVEPNSPVRIKSGYAFTSYNDSPIKKA